MEVSKKIAVVGSREFKNFAQLRDFLKNYLRYGDELISGGAIGADSFAQRYSKENGHYIQILYPNYGKFGKPATFIRNGDVAARASDVIAFYSKDRYQIGGTKDTVNKAEALGKNIIEIREE